VLFILTRTVQVPRRESCVAVLPERDHDPDIAKCFAPVERLDPRNPDKAGT
jgi:hypothetical protein